MSAPKRSRFSDAPPPDAVPVPLTPAVVAPITRRAVHLVKKKVYPAVAQYPGFDFAALLAVEKEPIERDTHAQLSMRGGGEDGPLHILIEAATEHDGNRAERMLRDVLADPSKMPEPVELPQNQLSVLRQSSMFGNRPASSSSSSYASDLITKEIRVPEDVAGCIIGRAGETVKRLQQDTGARIQIVRGGGGDGGGEQPHRVISIRAASQAVVDRAEAMILDIVHNRQSAAPSSSSSPAPFSSSSSQQVSEHYYVPSSRAGAVIGRQGGNIKALQQRFQCRISFPQDASAATPADHRTVLIQADTQDQIDQVKREIAAIVDSPQGVYLNETGGGVGGGGGGVEGVPVRIPDDKAGLIIGKQGVTIKSIQERLQVRIQIPNQPEPGTHMRTAIISGRNEQGVQLAIREIEAILSGELQTSMMGGGQHQHQQHQPYAAQHHHHQPYSQQQQQQPATIQPIQQQLQPQQQQGGGGGGGDYSAQWIEYYKQLDALPPDQREMAYAALREHQEQQQQQH